MENRGGSRAGQAGSIGGDQGLPGFKGDSRTKVGGEEVSRGSIRGREFQERKQRVQRSKG